MAIKERSSFAATAQVLPMQRRELPAELPSACQATMVGRLTISVRRSSSTPTDPKAYLERTSAKVELKDERGAARDLETFKIMYDRLDEGIKGHDTADAAYDSDDYEAAVRNYNKAISLLPSLTSVYYRRGLAKLCLEDYQGAIEDFNKSIETNAADKAHAYHQRGKIKRHKLNDTKGAMQDFNEAIALCPNESAFFLSRAKLSDGYDAFRDLNQAIGLEPGNAEALFYLGDNTIQNGRRCGCYSRPNTIHRPGAC